VKLACVDVITSGRTLRERFENLEKYGFEI